MNRAAPRTSTLVSMAIFLGLSATHGEAIDSDSAFERVVRPITSPTPAAKTLPRIAGPVLMIANYHTMREIELFRQYIGREPEERLIVFDVGAFDLRSTKQLKREFPNLIIHGFEADLRNHNRFLPRNLGENIYYNHYAISDREEVVRFYPSLKMGEKEWRCSGSICEPVVDENDCHKERWTTLSFDTEGTEVQSIRLDNYCRSRGISTIDYLHIDVQGAESRVMRGLGDVDARIVFAETNILGDRYYKTGTTLDEFDDFMAQAGYAIRYRDASDTLYLKR